MPHGTTRMWARIPVGCPAALIADHDLIDPVTIHVWYEPRIAVAVGAETG